MSAESTTPLAARDGAGETADVPLDEVMLAMDVVDTLRHERAQVEAELEEDQREQRLIARIQSIYESQGMEVPSAVIAEGVKALVEDRFTYEPPERGLAVRLAEIYVERGKWTLRLFIVLIVCAATWAAFAIPAHYSRQRQIESFRGDLTRIVQHADDLERKATRLEGVVADAHRPNEPAAAAEILTDAERNLRGTRGNLERLLSELEPGPDPESYPDDRERLDGVLTGYRAVLAGARADLGAVDGLLRSLESVRDVREQAERALVGLEGVPVSEDKRRELEASRAAILAAADAGRVDEARTGLRELKERVAGLVRAHNQRQSRIAELSRLAGRLQGVPLDAETEADLARLQASVQQAIDSHDDAAATRGLAELGELVSLLDQSYELRIVTGNRASGAWRKPPAHLRSNARNYYIIVEAIGPQGRPLSLRIKNEENGRTERVTSFGIRVPEEVYERVKKDKTDNGIIDNRLFGVKRRGARDPEYRFPVVGGRITRW